MTPTILLIHGAFAESSSWNDVADRLVDEGHRVIAYANPLRSVAGDAAGLTELLRTVDGPIVLAGHSYGGAVMTNVPHPIIPLYSPFPTPHSPPTTSPCHTSPRRDAHKARKKTTPPLHPAGQVPSAVLRRPARAPGPADSDHAAADPRVRAGRGLGDAPCGSRPAGSSSASWTATSRPARTATWPSGRAPGAPWRSPALRMSSGSRTPRRPLS